MTTPHSIEFRVRYAETDQMGVVYHSHYLVWCEVGRTELIRSLGVPYPDMERRGTLLAVAEASIRFHGAATYDDLVRVETTLTEVRSRTITFSYLIRHGASGARLATARTMLISLGRDRRPVPIPTDVRSILERAVVPTP